MSFSVSIFDVVGKDLLFSVFLCWQGLITVFLLSFFFFGRRKAGGSGVSSSSSGGGGSVKRRRRVGGRMSMASARSRRSVASDLMPVAEEDGTQQVRPPHF